MPRTSDGGWILDGDSAEDEAEFERMLAEEMKKASEQESMDKAPKVPDKP